jgi:hypothetical protein
MRPFRYSINVTGTGAEMTVQFVPDEDLHRHAIGGWTIAPCRLWRRVQQDIEVGR